MINPIIRSIKKTFKEKVTVKSISIYQMKKPVNFQPIDKVCRKKMASLSIWRSRTNNLLVDSLVITIGVISSLEVLLETSMVHWLQQSFSNGRQYMRKNKGIEKVEIIRLPTRWKILVILRISLQI